ncbi:MAG: exosortase system-associated protein, TIGR04073 family [Candidatus Hydrogenedentes bacterium]|nr:exosortase system-associated protein, TIGR04073 family [Candidatus Hydrogenedentota bacterium]
MYRMGERFWLKVAVIVVVTVFGMTGSLAYAQSYDPDQTVPTPSKLQKRINKLGRGLSNVLFGWTEIPLTFDKKMRAGKPLAYLLTTSLVTGATKGVMRTGVGFYEVLTFPQGGEEVNYEAILEPEYLF